MKIVSAFLLISLASCTSVKHKGTQVSAFGGRGVIKTKGQDGLTVVYDNVKSFRDLMVFAGVAASAGATAYGQAVQAGVDKAALSASTAQHAATQGTLQNTTNVAGKLGSQSISTNGALEIGSNTEGVINAIKR
jgi:hypothetical protein